MKMCKLGLAMVIAAVTMLTSCLGDSDSTTTLTGIPGVFRFKNMTMMVETPYGYIYSPDLLTKYSDFTDGDCVAVSFSYNSSAPENADSSKDYKTVTILGVDGLDSGQVYYQTDTSKLLDNEFALLEGAVFSSSYPLFAYLPSGVMFLTSGYSMLTKQVSDFQLCFDPSQEPVASSDTNGDIYTLFVRATYVNKGTTPATNVAATVGYNLKYIMDTINAREKGKSHTKFQLKICYVSDIEDGTTPVWKDVETKIPFDVTD